MGKKNYKDMPRFEKIKRRHRMQVSGQRRITTGAPEHDSLGYLPGDMFWLHNSLMKIPIKSRKYHPGLVVGAVNGFNFRVSPGTSGRRYQQDFEEAEVFTVNPEYFCGLNEVTKFSLLNYVHISRRHLEDQERATHLGRLSGGLLAELLCRLNTIM